MLDVVDRRIVAATQAGLPLVREPYRVIAEKVGLGQAEVIARLKRLLDEGAIRRIGAVPHHYALGFTANGMSVWDVADEAVAEFGARIGARRPPRIRRRGAGRVPPPRGPLAPGPRRRRCAPAHRGQRRRSPR